MPPALSAARDVHARATVSAERGSGGGLRLGLAGRLDARTTGEAWREAIHTVAEARPRALVVDASALDYADGSGIALLHALRRRQEDGGGTFEIVGLSPKLAPLLDLLAPPTQPVAPRGEALPFVASLGRGARNLLDEGVALVTFTGQVTAALAWAVAHPRRIRWGDVLLTAQRAGADAVGIVAIVGVLFGLILSFESASALQRFGAEIFMADGLAIGLFREMSALITAVILAGRSGSAFAAEIGTMKVNEEVDALTTMGIDPTIFLVVPRVVAGVAVMPILTMVFNAFGLIGGGIVFTSFGYGAITFWNRTVAAVTLEDLFGGLFKAFVFGVLVVSIGCQRGLQTRQGASAVGVSATRAVVSGIVLIAASDGVLAVVYYLMGL